MTVGDRVLAANLLDKESVGPCAAQLGELREELARVKSQAEAVCRGHEESLAMQRTIAEQARVIDELKAELTQPRQPVRSPPATARSPPSTARSPPLTARSSAGKGFTTPRQPFSARGAPLSARRKRGAELLVFREFLDVIEAPAEQVFVQLDVHKNGMVRQSDFVSKLQRMFYIGDANALWQDLDLYGDGIISFDEFMGIVAPVNGATTAAHSPRQPGVATRRLPPQRTATAMQPSRKSPPLGKLAATRLLESPHSSPPGSPPRSPMRSRPMTPDPSMSRTCVLDWRHMYAPQHSQPASKIEDIERKPPGKFAPLGNTPATTGKRWCSRVQLSERIRKKNAMDQEDHQPMLPFCRFPRSNNEPQTHHRRQPPTSRQAAALAGAAAVITAARSTPLQDACNFDLSCHSLPEEDPWEAAAYEQLLYEPSGVVRPAIEHSPHTQEDDGEDQAQSDAASLSPAERRLIASDVSYHSDIVNHSHIAPPREDQSESSERSIEIRLSAVRYPESPIQDDTRNGPRADEQQTEHQAVHLVEDVGIDTVKSHGSVTQRAPHESLRRQHEEFWATFRSDAPAGSGHQGKGDHPHTPLGATTPVTIATPPQSTQVTLATPPQNHGQSEPSTCKSTLTPRDGTPSTAVRRHHALLDPSPHVVQSDQQYHPSTHAGYLGQHHHQASWPPSPTQASRSYAYAEGNVRDSRSNLPGSEEATWAARSRSHQERIQKLQQQIAPLTGYSASRQTSQNLVSSKPSSRQGSYEPPPGPPQTAPERVVVTTAPPSAVASPAAPGQRPGSPYGWQASGSPLVAPMPVVWQPSAGPLLNRGGIGSTSRPVSPWPPPFDGRAVNVLSSPSTPAFRAMDPGAALPPVASQPYQFLSRNRSVPSNMVVRPSAAPPVPLFGAYASVGSRVASLSPPRSPVIETNNGRPSEWFGLPHTARAAMQPRATRDLPMPNATGAPSFGNFAVPLQAAPSRYVSGPTTRGLSPPMRMTQQHSTSQLAPGAPTSTLKAGSITEHFFKAVDTKQDGIIDKEEFRQALKSNLISPGASRQQSYVQPPGRPRLARTEAACHMI